MYVMIIINQVGKNELIFLPYHFTKLSKGKTANFLFFHRRITHPHPRHPSPPPVITLPVQLQPSLRVASQHIGSSKLCFTRKVSHEFHSLVNISELEGLKLLLQVYRFQFSPYSISRHI